MNKVTMIIILGLICHLNTYSQWKQILTSNGLATNSEKILSIGSTANVVIISTKDNGVYLSKDGGESWIKPSGQLPQNVLFSGSATINGKVFFGSANLNEGVFVSEDNGENWTILNSGLSDGSLGITTNVLLGSYNDKLFLSASKFYMSEDEGVTWVNAGSGLSVNPKIWDITSIGGKYYCSHKLVYKSEDGLNWTTPANNNLPFDNIRHIKSTGNTLVSHVSNNGLYYSDDEGENWSRVNGFNNNQDKFVYDLISVENKLYASTNLYIYYSEDEGKNWKLLDESGLRPTGFTTLHVNGSNLIGGKNTTTSGALWVRALTLTTSVEKFNLEIPNNFSLSQNYPNPFNPSTKINFSIPFSSNVSLKIFDLLGKEISELVSENKPAGNYSVDFDASKLSSGIYYYMLKAGRFSEGKKMMLIK